MSNSDRKAKVLDKRTKEQKFYNFCTYVLMSKTPKSIFCTYVLLSKTPKSIFPSYVLVSKTYVLVSKPKKNLYLCAKLQNSKNTMLKHIVLFQLKPELTEEQRQSVMDNFKKGIMELPAIIPEIQSIAVNFNCNPAEQWDICLESTFASLEALDGYAQHPAHKAVGAELRPNICGRSCVDYIL